MEDKAVLHWLIGMTTYIADMHYRLNQQEAIGET